MKFATQEETAEFVARSCGLDDVPWVKWTAIGVKDDKGMAGGVVFTDYNGRDIEAHIAVRPQSRGAVVFRYGFMYVFSQLQCVRISATIEVDNIKSRRICERLGFVQEGIKRQAGRHGQDCLIYGLLKHEITRAASSTRLYRLGHTTGRSDEQGAEVQSVQPLRVTDLGADA